MSFRQYYERKANGICTRCGDNKAEPGFTYCNECRDRKNKYRAELESNRRLNGLCTKCGEKTENGRAWCKRCTSRSVESHKVIFRRRKLDGTVCHRCGKPRELESRVYCGKCLAWSAQKEERTRKGKLERRAKAGKCMRCVAPLHPQIDKGYKTCINCREHHYLNTGR